MTSPRHEFGSRPSGTTNRRPNDDQSVPRSAGEARRRVVACLDGSELGECVIPHALAIAEALGAPVTLLRVLEGSPAGAGPSDPLEWEVRRSEAREHLDRIVQCRCAAGKRVETEVVEGRAAEQICRWVGHHEVDVTVLSSHGAAGRTEWSLAGTARKLVDRIPGPFLLVPATAAARGDVARYRRILVPVDGSLRAESVLPTATSLASAERAELILAHVVPVPEVTEIGPLDSEAVDLRERLVRRNERVAAAYLDRLRARVAATGVSLRTTILRAADVRTRLARLIADESVDLVVLSAHGRSARADVAFGSVAEYLIAHVDVPLLVLREGPPRAGMRLPEAAPREAVRLPSHASP